MKTMRSSLLPILLLGSTMTGLLLRAAEPDRVIGSIGETELHQSEVMDTLGKLDVAEREALVRDPAALGKLVRSMVVQRMVLKEALEKKWDQEPAVAALLQSAREAALTDSYLKSVCKPEASYPEEAELRAAYEASRTALTVPRSYRMAQIFIADEKGAAQKLKAVQERLKANPGAFAKVARETSEEEKSASRDGEIGWLNEQQIQPEILAQLPKLKLNVASAPVRLQDGWHLLKVLDVREPFTPIFDQVRAQLAQRLRAEKTRANMQSYVSKLLQDHPVALDEVELSKLLHEAAPQATANQP